MEIAVTDAHDPLPLRLNSQGLPLPDMRIRVLDIVTKQPLYPGEIGQLTVGGCVTPGYFNAPELNAEAFDRDGYFLTGDRGIIEPSRATCGHRAALRMTKGFLERRRGADRLWRRRLPRPGCA
jgi:long-subunit acyl-CoA synthetase (AMP-forming)